MVRKTIAEPVYFYNQKVLRSCGIDPLHSGIAFPYIYTHQRHIKQEDLQKEAQGGACDLIRSPSDCKTHLTPHSQRSFPLPLRRELKGGQKREIMKG